MQRNRIRMKRILVIYYTQSGQLKEIADNFVAPFQKQGIPVDFYEIQMETPYPFPWTNESFFGAFPESFLELPQPIKAMPPDIETQEYDLVVLAYQVWYLSPSIPVTSFLKSEQARVLLEGKPVVTLSGTRNMWIKAQEKVRNMLVKKGARIVANIALTDRHYNHFPSTRSFSEGYNQCYSIRRIGFKPFTKRRVSAVFTKRDCCSRGGTSKAFSNLS